MRFYLLLLALITLSCSTVKKTMPVAQSNSQQQYWTALQSLCGKAYEGAVVEAPANDTAFRNKTLVMHVRSCDDKIIRIPFFAGSDRSRTWLLTRDDNGLMLKHDHRHPDGTADSVTQYGGRTANSGSATLQVFAADQQTVNILPAAVGNVWWIEVVPGSYMTYNLRRVGTDRLFIVRFDLTKEVPAPAAPWGWGKPGL
jgi:hypothetical protein